MPQILAMKVLQDYGLRALCPLQESKLHAKYNKLLDKYVFEWDMCRNMERFADEY